MMGRVGPCDSSGKVVLYGQIFIVGYLQFVERERERERERAPAGSTAFKWVQSFSSGKETAHTSVQDWYLKTAKEWFRGAILKLIGGCR